MTQKQVVQTVKHNISLKRIIYLKIKICVYLLCNLNVKFIFTDSLYHLLFSLHDCFIMKVNVSVSAHGCANPFTGNILKTFTILHLLHTMQCLTHEYHIGTTGCCKEFHKFNDTMQVQHWVVEIQDIQDFDSLAKPNCAYLSLFTSGWSYSTFHTNCIVLCVFYTRFVKKPCFYCGSVCYTYNHRSLVKQKSNRFQIRFMIYKHLHTFQRQRMLPQQRKPAITLKHIYCKKYI